MYLWFPSLNPHPPGRKNGSERRRQLNSEENHTGNVYRNIPTLRNSCEEARPQTAGCEIVTSSKYCICTASGASGILWENKRRHETALLRGTEVKIVWRILEFTHRERRKLLCAFYSLYCVTMASVRHGPKLRELFIENFCFFKMFCRRCVFYPVVE